MAGEAKRMRKKALGLSQIRLGAPRAHRRQRSCRGGIVKSLVGRWWWTNESFSDADDYAHIHVTSLKYGVRLILPLLDLFDHEEAKRRAEKELMVQVCNMKLDFKKKEIAAI